MKQKHIYKATGKVNSITYYCYDGINKQEVISRIRSVTEASRFANNVSYWIVYDDTTGHAVAAGGMFADGKRYRLSDADLRDVYYF